MGRRPALALGSKHLFDGGWCAPRALARAENAVCAGPSCPDLRTHLLIQQLGSLAPLRPGWTQSLCRRSPPRLSVGNDVVRMRTPQLPTNTSGPLQSQTSGRVFRGPSPDTRYWVRVQAIGIECGGRGSSGTRSGDGFLDRLPSHLGKEGSVGLRVGRK